MFGVGVVWVFVGGVGEIEGVGGGWDRVVVGGGGGGCGVVLVVLCGLVCAGGFGGVGVGVSVMWCLW